MVPIAPPTLDTFVRPFSTVNPVMFTKVGLLAERFFTHTALTKFLSSVSSRVPQGRVLREGFTTAVTSVGTNSLMPHEAFPQSLHVKGLLPE